MATSVTEQITREHPDIEKYRMGLLSQAQMLAENIDPVTKKPLPADQTLQSFLGRGQVPQYDQSGQLTGYAPGGGAYQVAGFSQPQLDAMKAATGRGVDYYGDYLQQGKQALGSAYSTMGEAADVLRGADTRQQYLGAQAALGQAGTAAGGMGAGIAQLGQYSQANLAPAAMAYGAGMRGLSAAQRQAMGAQPDFGQAQNTITGGLGSLAGAAGRFQPSDTASFMDPYRQQVIDETMKQINRQAAISQQGAAAQAIRSGAFGGTREGVQRAEMERNVLDTKASTIANLLSQGYSQAQANAMATFEQQQQRQMQQGMGTGQLGAQLGSLEAQRAQLGQAGAGLYGNLSAQQIAAGQGLGQLGVQQAQLGQAAAQGAANIYGQQAGLYQNLGQGIGNLASQQFGIGQQMAAGLGGLGAQTGQLGVQYGAMGQTAQQMGQGDINFLYNIGQAQQANTQQQLDAARSTAMQQMYTPYQQAAFLSDIYRGAPSTQMATSIAQQPSANPFQQVVGTAIGAGTAYAGAKKAGLFGP